MFLFVFRDVSPVSQRISPMCFRKITTNCIQRRVRFVRFECYKKYLQVSNEFNDFFLSMQ
jgi:hypothetical protein